MIVLLKHVGAPTTPLMRARTGPETRSASVVSSFDLSDESVETLLKELQIEERIVDAARRMADMPAGNRKEKQQRRRSLQQWVAVYQLIKWVVINRTPSLCLGLRVDYFRCVSSTTLSKRGGASLRWPWITFPHRIDAFLYPILILYNKPSLSCVTRSYSVVFVVVCVIMTFPITSFALLMTSCRQWRKNRSLFCRFSTSKEEIHPKRAAYLGKEDSVERWTMSADNDKPFVCNVMGCGQVSVRISFAILSLVWSRCQSSYPFDCPQSIRLSCKVAVS